MEPHAIPRQITTFEFKLIGFLTLKQFLFLIICTAIGVIFYLGIPVPILNIFFAACSIALGAALAFLPVNERPLDVWIRNLINRLLQPSQYYYHKKEYAPDFLRNVYFQSTPPIPVQSARPRVNSPARPVSQPPVAVAQATISIPTPVPAPTQAPQNPTAQTTTPQTIQAGTVFLGGVVKNSKNTPLPNILIYIKNNQETTMRILKTNSLGQFATFHALEPGPYKLEPKDTSGKYFFDTMNIKVESSNPTPFVIVSKELL